MKTKKTLLCLVALLLLGIAALFVYNLNDGNYSYGNQQIAEQHANMRLFTSSGIPYVVRETTYDAKADQYIILLERATVYITPRGTFDIPIEEGEDAPLRVLFIEVTDGRVSRLERDSDGDAGYHWAEWSVERTPEKITVTSPHGKVYKFDATPNEVVELINPN